MSILIDAAAEYVTITDGAKWTWTPVSQDRALSLWWYSTSLPNAANEYQAFLWLNQSGGNKADFVLIFNGGVLMLLVIIYNSAMTGIGYMYAPASPSINTWHHIVFNASSSGASSIYLDKSSLSVTYSSWDDATEINPGIVRISDGSGVYDNMRIAHLAWFDRLLTSGEISTLNEDPAKAVKTSLVDNLLAYFPLDEAAGTTAYDKDPDTPTNGTLTNSPTWSTNPPFAKQGGLYIPQIPRMIQAPYRYLGL